MFGGGTLILIHIGALTRNKRQDFFIRMVAELKKMGQSVVGILIGATVTDADQQYKQELLNATREGELEKEIYFAGYRRNISDYLAVADCVVVPSVEGLSLAALEAMSARCRVVAQDCGGAAELLKNAGCGTLYKKNGTALDAAFAVRKALQEQAVRSLNKGYEYCLKQDTRSYIDQLKRLLMRANE